MKSTFLREQDYWIVPMSLLGIFLTSVFLYAGSSSMKIISGIIGLSTLYFGTYIIRKNYSKKLSTAYLIIVALAVSALTATLYFLTN